MQIKVTKKVDVSVKTLFASMGVRYWEDGRVDGVEDTEGELIPCRDGDYWRIKIDLETGIITNWKKGVSASVHYKVCDDGIYQLLNADGNTVIDRDYYVPSMLSPKENGHGDYVIMDIGEDGKIDGFKADLSYFEGED